MRLRLGASGAEKLCAGAIRRFCAAPQLHRYEARGMQCHD
jgi:hypothetical protein